MPKAFFINVAFLERGIPVGYAALIERYALLPRFAVNIDVN